MTKAMFAAGCFWSVQREFAVLDGVGDTAVGYSAGLLENPSYQSVCRGGTGHAETCLVTYDESMISYQSLLDTFWKIHNPTTLNRQGADMGSQYRSAIFYYSEEQRELAQEGKNNLIQKGILVVTDIEPACYFWRAEDYHQHYFGKP